MKKTIITSIILMIAFPLLSQVTHTVTFMTNGLTIDTIIASDSNTYSTVMLAQSVDYYSELGKPKLPLQTIQLSIPFDQVVSSISCTSNTEQDYFLKHSVYPSDSCGFLESIFIAPDPSVYQSNTAFPTSPIVGWKQDYFDTNNNIVSLSICPFEYYPTSRLLKYITSISITVSYTPGNRKEVVSIRRLQATQNLYDSILYHMVDNPNDIQNFKTASNIVEDLSHTQSGLPVFEYVVIAPRIYTSSLHDFVEWKTQKGRYTGIVNIEDILEAYPNGDEIGTSPIPDMAGSLRQYLHDAYLLGTSFVLLVGDPNPNESPSAFTFMPYRLASVVNDPPSGWDWANRPITDWYFSDVTGDWNVDNDLFYGEPIGDNVNRYADIFVGRLICSSNKDIENWVEKLLIYEKDPGMGNPNYVTKSLITSADRIAHSTLYSDILTHFTHIELSELPDYLDPNPYFPKGSDIISELNQHRYGLITWRNHGGTNFQHSCMLSMTGNIGASTSDFNKVWKLYSDSLCVDTDTNVQQDVGNSLDYMTNIKEPAIIYSTCCNVIPFNHTKTNSYNDSRNCGESFTVGGDYGGVAFLGNNLDVLINNLYIEFARKLDEAYTNSELSHLGILEATSKYYHNGLSGWEETHYKHNLIGDPDCQIWTDIPQSLIIDNIVPNTLTKEVRSSVEVIVSGFNLCDVGKNCTITLYSERDVFKTKVVTINEFGKAEAVFDSIFPTTTNAVSVTATCYNYIPDQKNITVVEECELLITENATWTNNISPLCDIVVCPKVTLTIKSEVSMRENCKIKVMPEGKLILDGGKLSCADHNRQWQGVRVLGTGSGAWQSEINGKNSQGYIGLLNNAEIKDALVAIDLWDGAHFETTGGIVTAKDAFFYNNSIAVRALYFRNINPINGLEANYNARFKDCQFEINREYPIGGTLFQQHIDLLKVKGVSIQGCNFLINNCPDGMATEDNAAICVRDAGCSVDSYCSNLSVYPCPDIDIVPSFFNGFSHGINASNATNSNSTLSVMNSMFINNTIGIRVLGDVNTTILFSDFVIGDDGNCGSGIELASVPSFCIEENTFTKSSNATQGANHFGIVASNTQSSNEIYRNTFSNLTCANYAQGINRNNLYEGLTYSCNSNFGNDIDVFIPSTVPFGSQYSGISTYQGSASIAAGNTFSQNGVQWQFYNGEQDIVTYYYNINSMEETPISNLCFNIRSFSSTTANDCLSHYTNGGNSLVLSPADKQQIEQDYYDSYYNYAGTISLLDSYIDGGDTQTEINSLRSVTADDVWELRANLLNLSPYLSQDVLVAFVNRNDVFPKSVLFEVLAANPDELGRDSLLTYIERNANLPSYMTSVLSQLANSEGTYRSILESQLSFYKHNYQRAAKTIIRSIMNDSIIDKAELLVWLSNAEEISADRQIIAYYLEEGNDSTAFALANMLPSLYELSGDDLIEHNGYIQLITLSDTLFQQHRTLFELTEGEMAMVDSLSMNGIGIARSIAQSLFETITGQSRMECPSFTFRENEGNEKGEENVLIEISEDCVTTALTITPNPANSWVEIDYSLGEIIDKAELTLSTLTGRVILKHVLTGDTGKKILDLRSIPQGIYFITIICGELSKSEKLVIVR